ncbi:M1-specific T cell receptor alpha chain-like [Anoplopoma fimbria]|uniref:M1-specific T cell receptor alpha chain-like n=1 Tax=Anoplopoma fimbria TaxID=229290 RepID=UPI0023EB775D|nr:M1-specific T cell receptor alpha chain-like [Anoplopoma fimbria]XP_054483285.1 M1-specific T cell receptor alpha chain-like [Anoplopoma fimbria]
MYSVNDAARKLIFGKGTKLFVQSDEEYKPSYFSLSDGHTSACLATGFSRINATKKEHEEIFSKTDAVRITDDSLYNQVAVFSSANETICAESASELCEETLQPDATVNMVSLTILGLRLLFLKTIVFNVLMTLRLWISQ